MITGAICLVWSKIDLRVDLPVVAIYCRNNMSVMGFYSLFLGTRFDINYYVKWIELCSETLNYAFCKSGTYSIHLCILFSWRLSQEKCVFIDHGRNTIILLVLLSSESNLYILCHHPSVGKHLDSIWLWKKYFFPLVPQFNPILTSMDEWRWKVERGVRLFSF